MKQLTLSALFSASIRIVFLFLVIRMHPSWALRNGTDNARMNRRTLFRKFATTVAALLGGEVCVGLPTAFVPGIPASGAAVPSKTTSASPSIAAGSNHASGESHCTTAAAYKPLSITVKEFGVDVPVACWFPTSTEQQQPSAISKKNCFGTALVPTATYRHRISVRRIGQLLAGWDFIPKFASRNFVLSPMLSSSSPRAVVDGRGLALPKSSHPVVLLAHGYLGSRFDLSHLAEQLATEGFICLAPEYPESLAASFERAPGLDRKVITDTLLDALVGQWDIQATSYGIVGHSAGCGTAIETGDDDWTRVCIAGFPRTRDGRTVPGNKLLFLSSLNDGAVSLARLGGINAIPLDFTVLAEADALGPGRLPSRAALVFDRPDAPNHISFLSENVNDAMLEFLSPLLPVAQTMSIPVLDFDRYQQARDSVATAAVVHPIVMEYLKQHMKIF